MSNYGNPPSDPYGNQPSDPNNPYGNQPSDPSNPYGNQPSDPSNPYGNQPSDPSNPYGNQPSDPSNPYGQQPASAYGSDPYGNQGGYGGVPGVPAGVQFAHWGKRVGAYLIDTLITTLVLIPYYIGAGITAADGSDGDSGGASGLGLILMLIFAVAAIAFVVWNNFIKQGSTGYTIGKGVLGIKLVGAADGQPIGAGKAFIRQLAHILDSIPCSIGYLWPLWDEKNQTFADKIMDTYVIEAPKP